MKKFRLTLIQKYSCYEQVIAEVDSESAEAIKESLADGTFLSKFKYDVVRQVQCSDQELEDVIVDYTDVEEV